MTLIMLTSASSCHAWADGANVPEVPDIIVSGEAASEFIDRFQTIGIALHQPTHGQNLVLTIDLFCSSHPGADVYQCILNDRFSDQGEPVGYEPIDIEGPMADELMTQLEASGVSGTIPDHAPFKVWNHQVFCERGAAQFDRCRFAKKVTQRGVTSGGDTHGRIARGVSDSVQSADDPVISFTRRAIDTACAIWGCTDADVAAECPLNIAPSAERVTCTVSAAELAELVMFITFNQKGQLESARSTGAGERARDQSLNEAQDYAQKLACAIWGQNCLLNNVKAECQKFEWDGGFLNSCLVEASSGGGVFNQMVIQLGSDLRFLGLEMAPLPTSNGSLQEIGPSSGAESHR